MMMRKRNGNSEEFDLAKVKRSLRNAGVDEKTANKIAKTVSEMECGSTEEIRFVAFEELKKLITRDSEIARSYDESRCLVARRAIETVRGTARLSEETIDAMCLNPGNSLRIINGDRRHCLNAYRNDDTDTKWNEIRLHQADLETIGASDGEKIICQRKRYPSSLIQYLHENNGGGSR